jgi:hypothetical protein
LSTGKEKEVKKEINRKKTRMQKRNKHKSVKEKLNKKKHEKWKN